MSAASLNSGTVIDLLPQPKQTAYRKIEGASGSLRSAVGTLSEYAGVFSSIRERLSTEQQNERYQKILVDYGFILTSLSEIIKDVGNFFDGNANDFLGCYRKDRRSSQTIISRLPDAVPVRNVIDIFNLNKKIGSLFSEHQVFDYKKQFLDADSRFYDICSVNLMGLVERRETLEQCLKGSISTNSNLNNALGSIKNATKVFGFLANSIKLSNKIFNFYEINGGVGYSLIGQSADGFYPIEYKFDVRSVFGSVIKNYGKFLNYCFKKYDCFSSFRQGVQSEVESVSFGVFKERLQLVQKLFEYIDGVFDFLKATDVFYLENGLFPRRVNAAGFEEMAQAAKQAIKSTKSLIACLPELENSNGVEGKKEEKNKPKNRQLKVGGIRAVAETSNRLLTASTPLETVVDETEESDHGLNNLVEFFSHLFVNDAENNKPKLVKNLESICNSIYFHNNNSCFKLNDVLNNVDAFWANCGLSASELVAGEEALRQIFQRNPEWQEHLGTFNAVVEAFKRDIVGRLELYKKSSTNTLIHLKALLEHDEIQNIDPPVFRKLAKNKDWFVSWTIRFKPTVGEAEHLCQLHIHYQEEVTFLDELQDKKPSWVHIKKTVNHEEKTKQLPTAKDALAFLVKAGALPPPPRVTAMVDPCE